MMKQWYWYLGLSLFSVVVGCGDALDLDQTVAESHDRGGAYQEVDPSLKVAGVGTSCADGCVWSGWAVSFGAQQATSSCDGTPCACVVQGDINSLCTTTSNATPPSTPVEPSTPISTESGNAAGDSCGSNCIWSGYAVAIGAQTQEKTCTGGVPCSCVVVDDIYRKCGDTSAPSQPEPTRPTSPPSSHSGGNDASRILHKHESGRITLWNQSFGRFDGADPLSNFRDASAGRPAKTSCYGGAPCNEVYLQARMVSSVRKLIEDKNLRFFVTSVAGARHSYGSKHYQGRAIDVDEVDGVRIYGNSAAADRFMQACRSLGATEVFGPSNDPYGHWDHIHCAW